MCREKCKLWRFSLFGFIACLLQTGKAQADFKSSSQWASGIKRWTRCSQYCCAHMKRIAAASMKGSVGLLGKSKYKRQSNRCKLSAAALWTAQKLLLSSDGSASDWARRDLSCWLFDCVLCWDLDLKGRNGAASAWRVGWMLPCRTVGDWIARLKFLYPYLHTPIMMCDDGPNLGWCAGWIAIAWKGFLDVLRCLDEQTGSGIMDEVMS